MPIPAQDQVLLRGRTHIIKPKLNIFPMQVVASAKVATTPVQYPIGALSVNNTLNWSKVRPGQLFRITDADGDIVTYGVVRLSPTSNILYIDGKARGDAGYARRLLRGIAVNNTISVFSFEPIWTLLSRIYKGVFYKNYDVPYTDQGSRPYPVCNIGPWRQVDANYLNGKGRLSFSNARSFAWFGANILSYTWTVPTGTVFVVGSASTPNITIDLPAGFHLIYCTITDNRGKSQTSFRPVWVNHPVLYPAASDLYGMEITTDSQDRAGREMTFRMYGDLPEDLFVPGGAILFSEEDIYENGAHLSNNVAITNYAGFMSNETPHYDLVGTKSIEIATKSPYKRMADIPMVSQAIVEVPSPANWTEIQNGYGTVDFVTWYILKHHTTFLDGFDYEPLREITNQARKKNWGLNGGTITEYLEQMGKMIRGNIGSGSDGTLYLRRDPTIEENAFRNALDERMTWTEDDITEPIDIPTSILPTVGQIRAFAFSYGATEELSAVAAIAPGFVQGMGPSKQDEESILVGDPATSQDKINRVAGHIYAKLNNPQPEIQIKPNRNMDVADPATMLWHRIDVSAPLNSLNDRLYMRMLPKSVDRTWENNGGTWLKRLTTTFEPETYGQPGETYILDKGGGSIYPPIDPGTDGTGTGTDINFKEFKFVIALDTEGNLGITSNAKNWRKLNGDIAGKICDVAVDWSSPYIESGFVNGRLGAWATALDGDLSTIRLYYTPDILLPNIGWQLAYETSGVYDPGSKVGVSSSLRVLTHPEDINHVIVVYWDNQGTHAFYTEDFAATFSDNISLSIPGEMDSINRDVYVGADVDTDGTLVASGIGASGTNYYVVALPQGGDESDLDFIYESPNGNAPYPMIKLNKDLNSGYATKLVKSTETDKQAIVNVSTYQISNPLNCEAATSGLYQTMKDFNWIPDDEDIDSPMCSAGIPPEYQPDKDIVFYTRNTYSQKPPGDLPLEADDYTVEVGMQMNLDGQWNIDSIDLGWAIDALAWSHKNALASNIGLGFGYYFTDGDDITISVTASNRSGIQFTDTITAHYNNDVYILSYLGSTFYCIGGVSGGSLKNFAWSGLDLKGITNISVRLVTEYTSRSGLETTEMGFDFWDESSPDQSWRCQLGITSLTVHGTLVSKDAPRLYKFEDYQTGPANFDNISPDGIWAPYHHYGLSIDPVTTDRLTSIQSRGNGTGSNLYTSTNGGDTFTPHGYVQYVGVHRVGQTSLFFGNNKMNIATNGITPIADIRGDWATAISKKTTNVFTHALSSATIV